MKMAMFEAKHYSQPEVPQEAESGPEIGTQPIRSQEAAAGQEYVESQRHATDEKPKTSELLKGIIEAAEHNQAIEKLFEMRHEAKDEKVSKPSAKDMSSIGEILDIRQASLTQLPVNKGSATTGQKNLFMRILHDNSLYGHAIRYGFVTALLALLSAVLLVTLFT